VTQFIVATPKSAPLAKAPTAFTSNDGVDAPVFRDLDGCNRYQQLGQGFFWASLTDRPQSHSSTPSNSPPTPRHLTVAYPAIKFAAQSARVVGGVAGASPTVCNSPRMQLDCNALHDVRCPWVWPFRRRGVHLRQCTVENAPGKAHRGKWRR
jgi:hypothetical protein